MNYTTTRPNPRFWTLKLIKDHFGPGDRLADTEPLSEDLTIQAFVTAHGRCLLAINKRLKPASFRLPSDFHGARIEYVAPSTGDNPPQSKDFSGDAVQLEPNEVAIISEK
jgi:hypothetical protein